MPWWVKVSWKLFHPSAEVNVIDYIGQLDNGKLKKMIANAVAQDLMIGLPRQKCSLIMILTDLKDMGIKTAFSDSADFQKWVQLHKYCCPEAA